MKILLGALVVSALLAQSSSAFFSFDDSDTAPMNSTGFEEFDRTDVAPMNSTGFEEMNEFLDQMETDENMQNADLFEGDMKLSEEQEALLKQRKVSNFARKWDPKVYYTLKTAGGDLEDAVNAGIDHWKEHTCIEFEEVASGYSDNHILFDDTTGGCWSYVGVVSYIPQTVSVPSGCQSLGTVVHEIGHALGLLHEQSRSDRDDYVTIGYENIKSGFEGNFNKGNTNNFNVPYDYTSVMHYGSQYFGVNNEFTIIAKETFSQAFVGGRGGLSHMDKLIANEYYGCIDKYMATCSLSENPCKNSGILQEDCTCVCPKGTSGNNCQTLDTPYRRALEEDLTDKETITDEGSFSSPRLSGSKMPILIEAPKCKHVQITFTYFKLYNRFSNNCYRFGQLYIMSTPGEVGVLKCGDDIQAGEQFTSDKNKMALYYESYQSSDNAKRFDIDIEFIDDTSLECLPPTIPPSLKNAPAPLKIYHEDSGECGWYDTQMDGKWVSTLTSPRSNKGDCEMVKFQTDGPQFLEVKLLRFYPKDEITLTLTDFVENTIEFKASDVNKAHIVPANGMISYNSKRGQDWPDDFVLQMKTVASPCIKMINADSSKDGVINMKSKHMCQWWFRVPEGYNLKLETGKFSIGKPGCTTSDFLAIGSVGATPTKYCGKTAQKPSVMTFTEREVLVYGYAMGKKTRYSIKYTYEATS